MDHKKNLEICEEASDGPWDVFHEDNVVVRTGEDDIAFYCAGHEKDGDFIAAFDPPTVRAYIERAIEFDELRVRCHGLANQVMVRDGRIMELEGWIRGLANAMTDDERGNGEPDSDLLEALRDMLK